MAELKTALLQQDVQNPPQALRVQGVKPLLRGIPDVVATIVAVPAAAILMASARAEATLAAVVYGLALTFMFAVSATYHTPYWPVAVRKWMRRLDHSTIYVFIAGTYTPMCLMVLPPETGRPLLAVVWAIGIAGVLQSVLWPQAPRVLATLFYVGFGWLIVPFVPPTDRRFGRSPLRRPGDRGSTLFHWGRGVRPALAQPLAPIFWLPRGVFIFL